MMAVAVVLSGAVMTGLARMGQTAVWRAKAQSAADSAALAGAAEGRSGAAALARSNGARLVAFEMVDGATRVTVQVGEVEAVARAVATFDEHPAGRRPMP